MTETTKTVFEKYQVRKSKKQKSAFIEYVKTKGAECGYEVQVENSAFGVRNIVVGNPKDARVVYTAHYDTCAAMFFPNFLTPKSFTVYFIYQLLITLALIAVWAVLAFSLGFGLGMLFQSLFENSELGIDIGVAISELAWVAFLFLMFFGPANKHTANDNTSGVATLLDIMAALPDDERERAAFIFFDLEELGLFGSSAYRSKHKKETADKLIINFDCVSDGENIIFALRRGARKHKSLIEEAYAPNESVKVEVLSRGVFYPSDQMCFPCGVGAAAFKSTKHGLLYINRIHTPRDTVWREENIEFLVNGSVKLVSML